MRRLFYVSSLEIGKLQGVIPIGPEVAVFDVAPATNPKDGSIVFANRPLKDMADATFMPRNCCILVHSCSDRKVIERLAMHNAVILTRTPRLAYAKVLSTLLSEISNSCSYTESNGAWIADSASIGENVLIEPGCLVDVGVRIGDGTLIMSGAKVRKFCTIGKNTVIASNSVIGADGFGYERDEYGIPVHLPHVGGVEVGDHVYVGACSTIASGTMEPTKVGNHVKVNNLVHVAHNCHIGARTMIGGGATICGSVSVGDGTWIGAGASIKQSCTIGESAVVGLGAVIVNDVGDNETVAGNPARLTTELSRVNRVIERLCLGPTDRSLENVDQSGT